MLLPRNLPTTRSRRDFRTDHDITGTLRRIKVTIKLPSRIFKQLPSKMRQGDTVQLRPVMFSQGINEAQVVADNSTTSTVMSLSNELQEIVNLMGLQLLQSFNREKMALERRRRQAMMTKFNADTKKLLLRQKCEAVECANLLENLEDVVQRSVKAHKTHFDLDSCRRHGSSVGWISSHELHVR